MILSLICLFSVSASLNGGFTTSASQIQSGLNSANNGNIPNLGTTNSSAPNVITTESSSLSPTNTKQTNLLPGKDTYRTIPDSGSNGTKYTTATTDINANENRTVSVINGTVSVTNGTETTTSTPPGNGTQTTTSTPPGNGTQTTTTPPGNGTQTTTSTPPGNGTQTTTSTPPGNGTQTTTSTPPGNGTQTTTIVPVTPVTVAPSPKSTTPEIKPASTTVPVFSTNATPVKDRRFDGPSFIGGIVLSLGTMAIGFVALKFYKARTEINYHTL